MGSMILTELNIKTLNKKKDLNVHKVSRMALIFINAC